MLFSFVFASNAHASAGENHATQNQSDTDTDTDMDTSAEAGNDTPSTSAQSTNPSPKDILNSQLKAVRERDAHLLWQYSSDSHRDQFRSPSEALRDVRKNKKALYNHLSFDFVETIDQGDKVIEKVELTTRSGSKVIAFFKLLKSEKGHWKVDNVTLLEADSQAI